MSEQGGIWRTLPNGTKIFIKTGQSLSAALDERHSKENNSQWFLEEQDEDAAYVAKYKEKMAEKAAYQEEAQQFNGDRIVKWTIEREMPNGEMITVEAGDSYNTAVKKMEQKKADELKKMTPEQLAEKGRFRTISGRKIFIEEGQSLEDALMVDGKFSVATRKNKLLDNIDKEIYKEPSINTVMMEGNDALKDVLSQLAPQGENNTVEQNDYRDWFKKADNTAKQRLVDKIDADDSLRNSGINVMYSQYRVMTADSGNKPLDFKEWVDTPIELFRGTSETKKQNKNSDVVLSYSQDIDMAAFFTSYNRGDSPRIEVIKVKPKHVLGSYNDDGENEVWVRQRNIWKRG